MKLALVRQILRRFGITLHMFNSFGFSLDFTVMTNSLQEIINILHEKMLKAINLHWFDKNTSEKNNSLNDRSNEPRING